MKNEILELIKNKKSFLIVTHNNADLDAFGSSLALSKILKSIGKNVVLFSTEDVSPVILKIVENKEFSFFSKEKPNQTFDACIILDCSSIDRLNISISEYLSNISFLKVNIDHHNTNNNFADINYVDEGASSTSEIIYDLSLKLKSNLDRDTRLLLLTGIIGDTGRFRYSNSKKNTFLIAGNIVQDDIDMDYICNILEKNFVLEDLHTMGQILSNTQEILSGKVLYSYVDLNLIQYEPSFDAIRGSSLINTFLQSKNAALAIHFIIKKDGFISVELRSQGNTNSAFIAKNFNGGGHIHASGFKTQKNFELIKDELFKFIIDNQTLIFKN